MNGDRVVKRLARKASLIDRNETAWVTAGYHYGEFGFREAARRLREIIAKAEQLEDSLPDGAK
jgi:hypothetical protein